MKKLIATKKIPVDKIYQMHKPHITHLVEKYSISNDPWLFKNTAIVQFACDYMNGDDCLRDDHPFILYNFDLYDVRTEEYKLTLQNRLISVCKSIKQNGYAKGKFKNRLIGLRVKDGKYELISGKHRAAACIACGKKTIKCNIYKVG